MPSVRPTATKFHGPQSPNQRTKPPMNTDKYRSVFTAGFSFCAVYAGEHALLFRFFPEPPVQTPGSGSGGEEVQEDERIQRRGFAAVAYGPESLWHVHHEIGHRHLAAQDERHGDGKKTQHHEHTPEC